VKTADNYPFLYPFLPAKYAWMQGKSGTDTRFPSEIRQNPLSTGNQEG
jgi:hypothetical protein